MKNGSSFYGGGYNSFYGNIDTYGDINNLYEYKELGPLSVVSFNNAIKNSKIKEMTINIDPAQGLHGYDNPWPAGGGKNLWPEYASETKNGVTIANDHGKLTINSENAENDVYFDIEVNYSVTAGQKIVVAGFNPVASPSSRLSLFAVTSTQTGNPQKNLDSVNAMFTVTANNDTQLVKLRLRVPAGETYTNFVLYPYLQIGGDTPTAWSPYSNICPITGWTGAKVQRTGKNIADPFYAETLPKTTQGITFTKNSDGTYHASGTATASAFFNITFTTRANGKRMPISRSFMGKPLFISTGSTKILPGTSYFRSDGSCSNVNNGSAVPEDAVSIRDYVYVAAGVSVDDDFYVQIELGSTATAYEPYQGNIYDISWQSEAGTVYGGTLDVTMGVLTVDRAMVTLDGSDDEGWGKSIYNYFGSSKISGALDENASPNNFLSNLYAYGVVSNVNQTLGACLIWASVRVRLADMSTSLDDWKDMLEAQPLQVIYPLATPQTYQLTPVQISTLLGENNVWADTGDIITLTYKVKK